MIEKELKDREKEEINNEKTRMCNFLEH